MERLILNIVLLVVFFFTLYQLITSFIILPSSKAKKNISKARVAEKKTTSLVDFLLSPLVRVIRPVVFMSSDKEERLAYILKKVGIEDDPKTFEAKCLAKSSMFIFLAVISYVLGITISAMGSFAYAFVYYIQTKDSIKKGVSKKSGEISLELPFFARTFISNIKSNNNVIPVLKSYYERRAGEALKYEIEITLSEMMTVDVNAEKSARVRALENMDMRINIPEMSSFLKGVIGTIKGEDQSAHFDIVERDMKVLALNNLDRRNRRDLVKINRVSMVVAIGSVVVIFIPFILFLISSSTMLAG